MFELSSIAEKLKKCYESTASYARELCQRDVSKTEIAAIIYALLVVAPYVSEALFDPDKENDFDGVDSGQIVEGSFFALMAFIANFPNVLYFCSDFFTNKLTRLRNGEMTRLEKAGLIAGMGFGAFAALAGITTAKDSLSKTVGKADWVVIVPFTFHVFLTRMFGISTLVKGAGDKLSSWFYSSTPTSYHSITMHSIFVKLVQISLAIIIIGLLPPWMQLVHNGLLPQLNPMVATWIGGPVNEIFYVVSAWVFLPRLLDYITRLINKSYHKLTVIFLVGLILAVAGTSGTAFMNLLTHQCQQFADVIADTLLAGDYNLYRLYWDALIKPWFQIVGLLGAGLSNASGMLGLILVLMSTAEFNERTPLLVNTYDDEDVETNSVLGAPGSEHELSDGYVSSSLHNQQSLTPTRRVTPAPLLSGGSRAASRRRSLFPTPAPPTPTHAPPSPNVPPPLPLP